jgi:hypothetical protein
MKDVPEQFDWVKARAECSILAVYQQLISEIEKDVERRNTLDTRAHARFSFKVIDANQCLVIRGDSGPLRIFKMADEFIAVLDRERNELLRATLTLSKFGRCMLKVADEELEHWQFLRTALEPLFFESYDLLG